ncbi:MAG TPA: hypothetical protein VFW66_10125 [Gemmatimonadales bacterium]|nr:hypothetical protein [Gemmatimonadales bacterium]
MFDSDDPLDPELRKLAATYHEPPPAPREEMWRAIEAGRRMAPRTSAHGVLVAGGGRVRRLAWVSGIAALLALGVGIGRLTVHVGGGAALPGSARPGAGVPANDAAAKSANGTAPLARARSEGTAYRLVAAEHLGQAEAFLTLFRAAAHERRNEPLALAPATARQLLATNRLLLDSPAADDPKLKLVLQDVELVLAQIAELSPQRRHEDIQSITAALERDGMLVRLRASVPSGSAATFSQGAL